MRIVWRSKIAAYFWPSNAISWSHRFCPNQHADSRIQAGGFAAVFAPASPGGEFAPDFPPAWAAASAFLPAFANVAFALDLKSSKDPGPERGLILSPSDRQEHANYMPLHSFRKNVSNLQVDTTDPEKIKKWDKGNQRSLELSYSVVSLDHLEKVLPLTFLARNAFFVHMRSK